MPEASAWNKPLEGVLLHAEKDGLFLYLQCDAQRYLYVDLIRRSGEVIGQPDWHYDRYAAVAENEALEAGENTLELTAILPGDVVVVQQFCYAVYSATVDRVTVKLRDSILSYEILDTTTVRDGYFESIKGPWDLKAGDTMAVTVQTATAGDKLYIKAWGRKIQD